MFGAVSWALRPGRMGRDLAELKGLGVLRPDDWPPELVGMGVEVPPLFVCLAVVGREVLRRGDSTGEDGAVCSITGEKTAVLLDTWRWWADSGSFGSESRMRARVAWGTAL